MLSKSMVPRFTSSLLDEEDEGGEMDEDVAPVSRLVKPVGEGKVGPGWLARFLAMRAAEPVDDGTVVLDIVE